MDIHDSQIGVNVCSFVSLFIFLCRPPRPFSVRCVLVHRHCPVMILFLDEVIIQTGFSQTPSSSQQAL